jgi:hypothetical protein
MSLSPFSQLVRVMYDAVLAAGAAVEDVAPELLGDRLNAEVWRDLLPGGGAERPVRDLPKTMTGARFDGTPVLLGTLGSQPTEPDAADLRDALRRYRNQATIARSWLGAEAQDLQLFLIGPPGSAEAASWRDAATEIEADERVCRKLVWLPSSDPTCDTAAAFLRRTFLAAPWRGTRVDAAPQLDLMSAVPLPPGWTAVIADETLTVDALVARLIEVSE